MIGISIAIGAGGRGGPDGDVPAGPSGGLLFGGIALTFGGQPLLFS